MALSPDVPWMEPLWNDTSSSQEPTALKCANWFVDVAGKCVSVMKIASMADVLQFLIDWITIVGCAFFTVVFLNRLIGFYNRRLEDVDKHPMWRNYLVRACCLLVVGCLCGFMSKMLSFMKLKPNAFMLTFNALWSQSYVIVWLAVGLIQLHYIELWVIRLKHFNFNSRRFQYSWVIVGAAALLTLLAVLYDLYINIVTDIYKSQNAYYVRVGWILMSLPYMQLCVLSMLMFPVVQKLRYVKGGSLAEMLNVWSCVILGASAFSVLVIYFFEFYPAGLSILMSEINATTVNATLRSYLIRLMVLLCNYVMLLGCIYALSFGSYIYIPVLGEIYYLTFPDRRRIAYAAEKQRREENGCLQDWSNTTSGTNSSGAKHHSVGHSTVDDQPTAPRTQQRHDYSVSPKSRSSRLMTSPGVDDDTDDTSSSTPADDKV